MLSVDETKAVKVDGARHSEGVQSGLQRRSRGVAEIGEDLLAARVRQEPLRRGNRIGRGGGEEGVDGAHEPIARVRRRHRVTGGRVEKRESEERVASGRREERRDVARSCPHERGYGRDWRPIVRSSRGDFASSHCRKSLDRARRSPVRVTNSRGRVTEDARAGTENLPESPRRSSAPPSPSRARVNFDRDPDRLRACADQRAGSRAEIVFARDARRNLLRRVAYFAGEGAPRPSRSPTG